MVTKKDKQETNGRSKGILALSPFDTKNGLLIKELEMLPKLEELQRLESLTVGGTTHISDEVVAALTNQAATEVEGVAQVGTSSLKTMVAERIGGAQKRARGVDVEAGRKEAILEITVRMIYGYSIPHTVILIRQNVAEKLLNICGLVAKEIDIRVVGLEFPDKLPGRVQ